MAIDSDEIRSRADELLDAGAHDPLDTMRHSAAHVMAAAVTELFPGAKLGIGPAIKDGFYYDFELPRPLTPADLDSHNRMGFGFVRHIDGWPFVDAEGRAVMVPITGNTLVSDGEAMRLMTLAGAGISRLARWHVAADIAAGRLVTLLEDFNPGDEEATHAVYVGQGRHLPARVRAFLDFLAETVRL